MTSYAIQAGALRSNPNSGPDGVGVQADIAYTLEARAEVQAVLPDNDNRPVAATASNAASNDNRTGLRFLSVCSGIEAASVAWPQWQAVAFSEIENFPSAVLAHHYPDVPNLGDMTNYKEWPDFHIDLLCGGTPCQAFSVAGLREGLNDPRGNLTLTFLGIAEKYQPEWIVWENVPGILSDKTVALVSFLDGLEALGYVVDIDILDAQFFGLAQRRRRVIVCGQNIKHILKKKTISSALTIAQFLQEISLSTLEELTTPSTSAQPGSGSNAISAALSRQRKMRLFGLLPGGVVSTSAGSLAEHLQWLEQELNGLASADGSSFQGATSHLGGIEPPTSPPTIMDLREGCQSTEPSWLNILAAPLQMMSESTTSTASKAITESKIYTCAQMTLCIARLMHQSMDSSPVFWSAAQSSLIALKGFINYARQTSSDLFAGMEWVRSWNDFIEQAVPVAEVVGSLSVECAGEVLSIRDCMSWDYPPRREARKDVAPTISARTKGGGGLGTDFDLDGGLIEAAHPLLAKANSSHDATKETYVPEIARCDATREGSSQDYETTTMVAQTVAIRGREGGATAELGGEVATALRASQGGGDKPHVLVGGVPEVAGTMKACAGKTGGFSNSADHAAAGYMVPVTTSAVRRLTPVECERLMGFPDNYTAIPWRGKPADQCPDGPRYKALGNSWAVPLFTWLGRRIDIHMPRTAANDNKEAARAA